jgi:hypothetical protein
MDVVQIEKFNWDSQHLAVKFIITAEHVYVLTIPFAQINDANTKVFFNNWKLSQTMPYQYGVDKTTEFIQALQHDTGKQVFYANIALHSYPCTPLLVDNLCAELLTHQTYSGPNDYTQMSYMIVQKLKECNIGNKFVDFYNANHSNTIDRKTQKYTLELLTHIGTDQAFAAIHQTIKRNKQNNINTHLPIYDLSTKAKKTSTFLQQDLLDMFTYKKIDECPLSLLSTLIDSGYLCHQDLVPYKAQLVKEAHEKLNTVKNGYCGQMAFVFECLLYFNDAESQKLLEQYMQLGLVDVDLSIIQSQLKLGIAPTQSLIDNVAKEASYANTLYKLLKAQRRQQMFTPQFLNLQHFALGAFQELAADSWNFNEEAPPIFTFHSQKDVTYGGEKFIAVVHILQFGNDTENKMRQYTVCLFENSNNNIHQQIQNQHLSVDEKYIGESNLMLFLEKTIHDLQLQKTSKKLSN